jgi:site-specific recombinase XerD
MFPNHMDIQLLILKFIDYSTFMRGHTKDTIRKYRGTVRYYCKFSGIQSIREVNNKNVREFFIYGRVQKNWSARTFVTYYHDLIVFFRWCVTNGYLSENPIIGIELPKLEKRLPQVVTRQGAMKLLEIIYNYPYDYKYLRYRNHAIFATFIFAGLRKSELLNLKFSDVDIANLSIFVRQGKGSKDRILPISFALAQSLKAYLIERQRLGKTCEYFFASLNRNSGFTEIGLKRLVVKIREASGIFFTAHTLRHTFATLMIESGCDIFNLSVMMGHSDIKTTSIYLHSTVEFLRSKINNHPLNNLVP